MSRKRNQVDIHAVFNGGNLVGNNNTPLHVNEMVLRNDGDVLVKLARKCWQGARINYMSRSMNRIFSLFHMHYSRYCRAMSATPFIWKLELVANGYYDRFYAWITGSKTWNQIPIQPALSPWPMIGIDLHDRNTLINHRVTVQYDVTQLYSLMRVKTFGNLPSSTYNDRGWSLFEAHLPETLILETSVITTMGYGKMWIDVWVFQQRNEWPDKTVTRTIQYGSALLIGCLTEWSNPKYNFVHLIPIAYNVWQRSVMEHLKSVISVLDVVPCIVEYLDPQKFIDLPDDVAKWRNSD